MMLVMELKFVPPKFVTALYRAFPTAEVFLVGGLVRDLLLKRASKDIDLVVRGVPLAKLIKFLNACGRVDVVGRSFGVIKFVERQRVSQPTNLRQISAPMVIDIALPRTEISGDSGVYTDVAVRSQFNLPIEADLARRDFTINAIALNLKTNELIDPFDGQIDLKKKILRAVGDPTQRFQEDYTRVLRGLRFACQLNFNIEPTTWRALKKFTPRLNETLPTNKTSLDEKKIGPQRKVPQELIGREFMKSLCADSERFMDLWYQSGAFAAVVPELLKMRRCPQPRNYHTEGDVWQHTILALKNLRGASYQKFLRQLPKIYTRSTFLQASPTQYLTTLLHDVAKPTTIQTPKKDRVDRIRFTGHDIIGAKLARAIAERLRLSSVEGLNVDIELSAWLIEHHLLAVQADVAAMKATTIEKYFLRDLTNGRELLTLLFADGAATVPANKKTAPRHLDAVLKRVRQILRSGGDQKQILAKPLVSGHDILRVFKIAPGPQVGQMLQLTREAQLSGRAKNKNELLKLLRAAYKNNF